MRWVGKQVSGLWWRLVRFGFRLLYNELAFSYDTVSGIVSLGAWRDWQRAVLQFLPEHEPGLILELAHGTGNLQADLHAHGYRSIGYDLSPKMGQIARRKLQEREIAVRLVRGAGQALPFADQSFPQMVCTFPTRFLFMDDTLHEIDRVLCTKGRLIAVLHGNLAQSGFVSGFIEWLYRITGQTASTEHASEELEALVKHLSRFSLQAEWQVVPCERGSALVLIAEKSY